MVDKGPNVHSCAPLTVEILIVYVPNVLCKYGYENTVENCILMNYFSVQLEGSISCKVLLDFYLLAGHLTKLEHGLLGTEDE